MSKVRRLLCILIVVGMVNSPSLTLAASQRMILRAGGLIQETPSSGVVVKTEVDSSLPEQYISILNDLASVVPAEWVASPPETARYEISLRFVPVTVGNCSYENGVATIVHQRMDVQVTVTDLETSAVIASETVDGESVDTGCPLTVSLYTGANFWRGSPLAQDVLLSKLLEMMKTTDLPVQGSATANTPLILIGHRDQVWTAAYSPDGNFIATSSADGIGLIWDALTGEELHRLSLGGNPRYSPDGRFIVTTSWDGTARVWDVSDLANAH
ncbi:MAG: hypothetical protein KJ064_05440 [Anaerolineae bacterium]|nr:hypothetical protein [Anaerolineae bacterium]